MAFATIDVTKGISGVLPAANATYASLRPNAQPLIINGDMQVAQRSTSETSKTSGGYYTCDRMYANIDSIGTYTIAQESLSSGNAYNNGFRKAWRIDTTTADASPAASDNFSFIYSFEGQDLQLFKKGTSNAKKFTLSFWVKSNKTGTGNVNLFDTDNTRLIGGTYTISSADTWEHKVVNYAADTTGALNNDNGQSLKIEWFLDSGTNFSSGTTDTTWGAKDDTDRNASGTLQIARNTANDWAITGVQLEVGEYTSATLPDFQHESHGDNEMRCMRYYQNTWNTVNGQYPVSTATTNTVITTSWNDGNAPFQGMFPVQMRSTPTVTFYARGDGASGNVNQNGSNKSCSPADTSEKTIGYLNVSSGTASVYTAWMHVLNAEL